MELNVTIPVWILTTFGVYLLTSLIASVWWAASIATTLNFMKSSIEKMEKHISSADSIYATKLDVAKDFAFRDQRIEAAWKKLDSLSTIK